MTGSEHCSPRQPDLDVMKQETVGLEEVMAETGEFPWQVAILFGGPELYRKIFQAGKYFGKY